MAVKLNAELDAYFNTGDQPSESNFQDLIDTIQPPLVELSDADTSLTVADHAFRTLIMPALGADRTLTMPTPAAHVWFHIEYFGDLAGADGSEDLKIVTNTLNSEFFHGMVTHLDTDNAIASVHGNGSSNDSIDVLAADGASLWFLGKSSTVWYVWGTITAATTPTIADTLS